VNIKLNTVF